MADGGYSSESEDSQTTQEARASRKQEPKKEAAVTTKTKQVKTDQATKLQKKGKKVEVKARKTVGGTETPSLQNGGLILRTPGVTDAIHASKIFYQERVKELSKVNGGEGTQH